MKIKKVQNNNAKRKKEKSKTILKWKVNKWKVN